MRTVKWVVLGALVACDDPAEDAPVDVTTATPVSLSVGEGAADAVIRFSADWSIDTADLREGMTVAVDYDPARLPHCRGEKYGQPAWSLLMYWQIGDGPLRQQVVAGPGAPADGLPALQLDAAGTLQAWFLNSDVWGCHDWDSDFGRNHRLEVAAGAPAWSGWVGNGASVISRATCAGAPCEGSGVALDQGFNYGTWARQRATIKDLYFEVWQAGVTDWNNPEVWRALDVQVHWQWDGGPSGTAYVDHFDFVGNNARYRWPLRTWDIVPGNTVVDPANCPPVPLRRSADGNYVEADLSYHFTVNGARYPQDDLRGTFADYVGLYEACL